MIKLYLDTECNGLNGKCKLIQYSIDDEIKLIKLLDTKSLSEIRTELKELHDLLYSEDVIFIGYNIPFDLYHLYRVFHYYFYELELCSPVRPIQPFECQYLDLYLHAKKESIIAPYAFSSKKIILKKIPVICSEIVCETVENVLRDYLPSNISFIRHEHKLKNKNLVSYSWEVKAKFGLKNLISLYDKEEKILKINDVWNTYPKQYNEKLYLPYYENDEIHYHINKLNEEILLNDNNEFFKYAKNDIAYLKKLEKYLNNPTSNYDDIISGIVAYTRYFGFAIDEKKLNDTILYYKEKISSCEKLLSNINPRSSKQRLELLKQYIPNIESTNKKVLKSIINNFVPKNEKEILFYSTVKALVEYGSYKQKLDQCLKLAESKTGKGHPDFKIVGAASGRMSGFNKFNWQGITSTEGNFGIRNAIKTSMGGDFSSLEITIAAAAYDDITLQTDLYKNIDIHSMTASVVMPEYGYIYDDIERLKKINPEVNSLRQKGKMLNFCMLYGGSVFKVIEILGCTQEQAETALTNFFKRYAGLKNYREKIHKLFCTADTEHWKEDSINSMNDNLTTILDNKRYWKFEKDMCNIFWKLGHSKLNLPIGNIIRNEIKGNQTIDNAVKSAFLGSVITLQKNVARQAGNHLIQAVGADLTKRLMCEIWNQYKIPMMNIHDEIQVPDGFGNRFKDIYNTVKKFINIYKQIIPSLGMEFKQTKYWSDK